MPTAIAEATTPVRLETLAALRRWSERSRAAGLRVGLVPTMGALHQGHLSLLRRARLECDRVAASVFVNPRQFGPGEDLDRYPRQPDADLAQLAEEGVDAVLLPGVEAVYGPEHATSVHVSGPVGTDLEAACRPGHLDGVALVVVKLLAAGRPERVYLGEKDAQQCALVERLVADLDLGAEVVVCPTVRDSDGLALSSRNAYLSASERGLARALPAALGVVSSRYAAGVREASALRAAALERLTQDGGLAVDYVAVVDAATFEQPHRAGPGCRLVIAARVGGARLLDAVTFPGHPPGTGPAMTLAAEAGAVASGAGR